MAALRTLNELFLGATDRFARRAVAMRAKADGRWYELSFADLARRVQDASIGLSALGIRPGDRVAILSENRPEWAISDYACLATGCVDVPVYPTLPAHQIAYLLHDSAAVAIAVSNQAQLEKILAIRPELPALRHIVSFDAGVTAEGVLTFRKLEEMGREAAPKYPAWRETALAIRPDDLATIIYTSGTTGEPKGVMLTHGNIASNVSAGLEILHATDADECLSFLPLSHIFERMTGHYSMLQAGVIINYAESFDTLSQDLLHWRPTIVAAVPRVYEKIYAKALETALDGSPVIQRLFFWSKRVGAKWADLRLAKRQVPLTLRLAHGVADRLVFSKIRARVGGRLRYFISGGAPLSPEIARFFYAADLPILEGYGLTETSPVLAVNTLDAIRIGTVGKVLRGVEIRIADDGEILARGPNVMRGYYNKPEATAAAIDPQGWFHTGDIGEIDGDGFLKITDRKKDLIITAGGKKIAPQPIESLLKTNPFFTNAVMLGDKRKFPIVLLVPNLVKLREWATARGISDTDPWALVARPDVQTLLEGEAKKHLRDLAQFEVPKKFLILPREFSIETGELTPKLSVKRRVVEDHYRREIEALYQETPGQSD